MGKFEEIPGKEKVLKDACQGGISASSAECGEYEGV